MRKILSALFILLITLTAAAQVEPLLLYKANHNKQCTRWVDETMSKMTLKEKVGQLFIYTLAPEE